MEDDILREIGSTAPLIFIYLGGISRSPRLARSFLSSREKIGSNELYPSFSSFLALDNPEARSSIVFGWDSQDGLSNWRERKAGSNYVADAARRLELLFTKALDRAGSRLRLRRPPPPPPPPSHPPRFVPLVVYECIGRAIAGRSVKCVCISDLTTLISSRVLSLYVSSRATATKLMRFWYDRLLAAPRRRLRDRLARTVSGRENWPRLHFSRASRVCRSDDRS